MHLLTSRSGSVPMSTPSTSILPFAMSIIRNRAISRVVLPEPVRPTMPICRQHMPSNHSQTQGEPCCLKQQWEKHYTRAQECGSLCLEPRESWLLTNSKSIPVL
eukprot:GHRR01037381.1.p1 GENE.GHRR01037381.1~~GHRR01037381.1.p1  ORF type:complete len:104 (-),score=4.23 GHRR01037381.1:154-465(-)